MFPLQNLAHKELRQTMLVKVVVKESLAMIMLYILDNLTFSLTTCHMQFNSIEARWKTETYYGNLLAHIFPV